jgi:hypothetical protein
LEPKASPAHRGASDGGSDPPSCRIWSLSGYQSGRTCWQLDSIASVPKRTLCTQNLILEAAWIGYTARCIAEGERMSSTVFQIASIVAGLALLATQIFAVPRNGIKGLVKGIAVTVSLAIFAACLMTAIRSFGS